MMSEIFVNFFDFDVEGFVVYCGSLGEKLFCVK